MSKKSLERSGWGSSAWSFAHRFMVPLLLVLTGVFAPAGCSCGPDVTPPRPRTLIPCRSHTPRRPTAPPVTTGTPSIVPGAIPHTFSVTATGSAALALPLTAVPGRAGVEPDLSLTYDSAAAGTGSILGSGFSLSGLTAVARCGSTLARDNEIRAVRYDAKDNLCLSGQRLVVVADQPGLLELRTFPDTFTKVIGHYAREDDKPGNAQSFEIHLPTGLVIDAGTTPASRPLAPGGVARAWLAEKAHDGRGNAMTYGYCFADDPDSGTTAEYALDTIRYTSFEGDPALDASRAVDLVYGTKDPADQRTHYAGGMALQSSLRLDEVRMVGPGDALVRRYAFTYDLGPTTRRTRLTEVSACAGDGACLPPTRFQYAPSTTGFETIPTSIPAPVSRKGSPMLLDVDGDGLVDLVSPDADPALSTPSNPTTLWLVAHNRGVVGASPSFAAPMKAFVEQAFPGSPPTQPADPALIQPEVGTALDYNQDGRTDVLLHDVSDRHDHWRVLLARPDGAFAIVETGIRRPFPLGQTPAPPALTTTAASMHLADVSGDGVPDLIQCDDHNTTPDGEPGRAAWTAHLWKAVVGATPAGFDPMSEPIAPLEGVPCNAPLFPLDVDGDGKVDLVVDVLRSYSGSVAAPDATYSALTRRHDGGWDMRDTRLPIPGVSGRVLFLDVNGDGLPDAMESGFGDHALRTYLNRGTTFDPYPAESFPATGFGDPDTYFHLATPFDFNGDGLQDLLMPVPPGILPGASDTLPSWAVLQAKGALSPGAFALVDPGLPFEALLGEAVTLADPHGPRTGDIDGDGAEDVVIPLGGVFTIFRNRAADPDLLTAVVDGMNDHDPEDPGFVPTTAISYGHLTDRSITETIPSDDPALANLTYRAHADATNDCSYPRTCAVGPLRVVSGYAMDNGVGGARRFAVRYRDGRYDRLRAGFLGFGARVIADLDTGAGTEERYDNQTFDEARSEYPFAAQVQHERRWFPGLPDQPAPERIELSFTDVERTLVATHGQASYFTVPTKRRVRRAQGVLAGAIEDYVAGVEKSGAVATMLRDVTTTVLDFDPFGNVLDEDVTVSGVDLTFHVERTFKNDTDRWVLGQLQTQKECSAAAMLAQCRTLTRTTTIFGEVEREATASDDGSPDTVLATVYTRDAFGNIERITEDDAHGHHRVTRATYDVEGIYPATLTDAADHVARVEYDARLGVLTKVIDPNLLVTTWDHDGFGRLELEKRPDGTQTSITRTRTKDGGLDHQSFRVTQRTTTPGGADDTALLDSKGRPIRRFWHGPEPLDGPATPPRQMQVIAYDALGEHIARRSVPVREDTPDAKLLFDAYTYDALGREVEHKAPWGLTVSTSYDASVLHVSDSLGHETTAHQDPLGRPLSITDAAKGITAYTYGPFGMLHTVTDPGAALTRMTRDALGRVQKLDDPDRGTTILHHDGFGELVSSTDALGRATTYDFDPLGRPLTRTDQEGAKQRVTAWTWDLAAHGIGKLQALVTPDGTKSYTYNAHGQVETLSLAVTGESDVMTGRLDYDSAGRVSAITYPTPAGAPPFVVAQDYDAHGHLLTARDSTTSAPYWRLAAVDDAGRVEKELLGTHVTTERSYFADKQALKHILTTGPGGAEIQDLTYDYTARRSLKSRADALQIQHPIERFRYDALDRVTCAYFGAVESDAAPCDLGYGYDPSGNLTFKSDVGALAYDDPAHPHAVTGACADSFGYDAVGNQVVRPGGAVVTYTPFDLPATLTQGLSSFSFGYDGDEQRIRKTTPDEETLYFEGLYERVTSSSAPTAHRYSVRSPERVVAIVTRGGSEPGTRYLHADHLGSTDVVTDDAGAVREQRSYDPFGQRRNPTWGAPPPASFSSVTTQGFTGHESDGELGLVNMKGRIYDPRLGRFLTMDPVVQAPLSGQSWNPYAYVMNNPLSAVDPSGFQEEPPQPIKAVSAVAEWGKDGGPDVLTLEFTKKKSPAPKEAEGPREAVQVGAAARPVDVGTLGTPSGVPASAVTATPKDWTQHPLVQLEGGFLAGVVLGLVPFGGLGHQFFDAARALPRGTPESRVGLAIGLMMGGIFATVGGVGGEVLGGIASATGIGAAIGVPAIAVSTVVVVGGVGNILAGWEALQTTGSVKGPRNGHLAGETHPKTGVPFDKNGYPDFKAAGVVEKEVQITQTGNRPGDFKAANRAAGLKETPRGYTWHHHQDRKTMQLVPTKIHDATGHTGGFSNGQQ